ncbi:MAG: hypothetical protein WA417_23595, partial [Stellaceae bacterium]
MERTEDAPKQPPIRTATPVLASFVLYAERSVRLGERGRVWGGDVGVHAIAEAAYGAQLRICRRCDIDPCRNLYAPSVLLAREVRLGVLQANRLEDDGIILGSPVPYPAAAMPPL